MGMARGQELQVLVQPAKRIQKVCQIDFLDLGK